MWMDLLAAGALLAVWLGSVVGAKVFLRSFDRSHPVATTTHAAAPSDWPVVATTRQAADAERTNIAPEMFGRRS